MAQIELRLSSREQENGTREILIRFYQGSKFNLRAKSEIYINPEYFEYKINWGKTLEAGIAMPKKTIKTTTLGNAAKRGYILHDCGEIVVNEQRVINYREKKEIKEKQGKISRLKDFISKCYEQADKDEVKGNWLKDVIDRFNHPEKYEPVREKKQTFYELAEVYLAQKQFSYDHTKGFRVLVRAVARYEGFRRYNEAAVEERRDLTKILTSEDRFTFDPDILTSDDIEDFRDYLRNEKDLSEEYKRLYKRMLDNYPANIKRGYHEIEGRGENAVIKLMKKLKAFFGWLYETGRITNRPFDRVKIGTEKYGTPYYITIDERNTIASTSMPTKHLEVQRDIFIFHCFVGCRVSDLMKLTERNITDGILEYTPHKTKDEGETPVTAKVPLHEKAVALVEKYRGADKKGRLFPFISSQKYNDAIKEIFAISGITRNVEVRNAKTGETEIRPLNEVASSHLARRTFVGNAYKQVSDPNIICKMSGHVEGSKAFARYRNIENDTLMDVINKIG